MSGEGPSFDTDQDCYGDEGCFALNLWIADIAGSILFLPLSLSFLLNPFLVILRECVLEAPSVG